MIIVVTTQIRPTTEAPFYLEAFPELASLMKQLTLNYVGFSEPPKVQLFDGGLRHVVTAKYPTQEALDTFLAGMAVFAPNFFVDRKTYSDNVGITIMREITEA